MVSSFFGPICLLAQTYVSAWSCIMQRISRVNAALISAGNSVRKWAAKIKTHSSHRRLCFTGVQVSAAVVWLSSPTIKPNYKESSIASVMMKWNILIFLLLSVCCKTHQRWEGRDRPPFKNSKNQQAKWQAGGKWVSSKFLSGGNRAFNFMLILGISSKCEFKISLNFYTPQHACVCVPVCEQ